MREQKINSNYWSCLVKCRNAHRRTVILYLPILRPTNGSFKEQHLHHITLKSKLPSLWDVHFQNYLALPPLLNDWETWAIREQDASRITSADVKFMRTLKYIWQYYRTNVYNLSEIKINPVVNKIQNYKSKWIQHLRRMGTDRLQLLIMKYQSCGKRSQGRTHKRLSDC
jgi:hypothetical protein